MSGWVTVWDVASEPVRWGSAGEGLWAASALFLGISWAVVLRRRSALAAALALAVSGCVAGGVVWGSLAHHRHHLACVQASLHDEGRVLEGVVRDYERLSSYWQRPAEERFTLAGEALRLPLISGACGYHRTTLEGGAFRNGLRVRLLTWRGQILRVTVDRDALLGIVQVGQ
ncbi:hypothetical protein [Anaeromyxobacter diazotrophicus]|uniref:Uncharacterized protein n=1 Tax=Anaeromyxobacter diazotrophicus TaxID=2590199 RepID=A0A7I9VTF2_9BACT|nr:hypothetical protein [Anaeromyxobacter diazotrophicus]GEJ59518.1 hypothetical protein AMYX_42590 [Anaeromyxobacter diazotrophicus]